LNKRSFPTKNLGKMNRTFLKEAIADAKAVKESAIANAKVALEEAFSPQVQAMFSSKIEEMEKDEVEEGKDEVDEVKDDAKVEEKMSNPVMRKGDHGDNKAERETEYMREEEDMDLDEILAELEKDGLEENARTDAEEEGYKDGIKDEKEDLKEDERTDAEEEGYLDGEEDEKEDEEDKNEDEDEDIDIEDMSEDDLKKFIEDVIEDMVTAGELEAGEDFESEDVEVEDDEEIEVEDEVEVTMDENARTDAEEEGYKDGIKDEKEDIKKDLEEAMDTVATLRSELNEINLLNAKLLYTNKVFRGKNLSESQKVKVLGAFDKAETVKEVKLVFETINSSVKSRSTSNSISEGFRAKGSASATTHTSNVSKKQPIVESDEMVNRFKKLAGLI
jgi:hypothetical protein|tara:strand:- start:37 stop:1206 length:1170 start_codon:yes stop_codon:yes gene_type:complete